MSGLVPERGPYRSEEAWLRQFPGIHPSQRYPYGDGYEAGRFRGLLLGVVLGMASVVIVWMFKSP